MSEGEPVPVPAVDQYDPTKDPKMRPSNWQSPNGDPGWKHAIYADLKNKNEVKCLLCGKIVNSGIGRLKRHLVGTYRDVMRCANATAEIRKAMEAALKKGKRGSKPGLVEDIDAAVDGGDDVVEEVQRPAPRVPTQRTGTAAPASQKPQKSVSDMLRKTAEEVIADRHMLGKNQKSFEQFARKTKEQKLIVDDHVADFFYENGIPFNAASSRSWEILLESVGQYGPGYKTPSTHSLRVPLLARAKSKTEKLREKHESAWKEYGCTLMSDGWTDMKGRHLINFLVNSPEGTFFLDSVDASSEKADAKLLAKLLQNRIDLIGPENVIQLVTDNGSNYKAAGRLLMEENRSLFWTPCAAHCLDLMLEDIGNIKDFKHCIGAAKRVTRYIYRHGRILELMRANLHGNDIVRPATTRFATSFLTLSSMYKHRQGLKAMFVSKEWNDNLLSQQAEGTAVASEILSPSFWTKLECCMRASQPLLIVLRLADGDERPAMPEISAAMEIAKKTIKESLAHKPTMLKEVLAIVDKRWDNQMEQNLYGAALFLNPARFFQIRENDKRRATRLRSMFNDVVWKMVPDDEKNSMISRQADDYERTEGDCFTKEMCVRDRDKKTPLRWWGAYGGLAFELQTLAKRIVSLCCSASGCERNWSTFSFFHTKKRNRLEHQRLSTLVYVSYNRKMSRRFEKIREASSQGKLSNPLILEDFQWDNEWVDINAEPVDPYSENGLLWGQVGEASGATENVRGRNFPRQARVEVEDDRPRGPPITYNRTKRRRTEDRDEVEEQHNDGNEMQCDYGRDDDDEDIQHEVASPPEVASAFHLDDALNG